MTFPRPSRILRLTNIIKKYIIVERSNMKIIYYFNFIVLFSNKTDNFQSSYYNRILKCLRF